MVCALREIIEFGAVLDDSLFSGAAFLVWVGYIFAVNRVNRSKKIDHCILFAVIHCLFSVNIYEGIFQNQLISLNVF